MKKKSTQFRWLVTMLLLVTAMAIPKMAWAQVKYTVFDSSSGTLTFKYGVKPTGGEGITVYDIPDASSLPGWNSQASSITTVVFDDSFKDARPTTCYCWFSFCTSLTTINGIENLNTEDVTDMDNMFYNCSSLSTLDLSGFNTANVRYMGMMFCNCSKLTTIYASSKFTISAGTSSLHMFLECTSLVGAIKYDSSKTDASYANTTNGYFSIKGSETKPKGAYVVYTDADNTLTFKYGEIPTGGGGITVYYIPDVSTSPKWNLQASSITTVVFDKSFKDIRPTTCYCWFQDCTSLTTINGIENLNTEDVTNMQNMFYKCSSLTTLDLSGFNTAKVEDMNSMFYGCSELTTIYASSNFTTTAVTSSGDMFTGCTSLVGAVAYSSDKTNVGYANTTNGYFKNLGDCSAYAVFNRSNNSLTFKYDTKISQLAENEVLCTIKSDNQEQGWYNDRTSINKVVFEPSFASARPVTCYHWFYECSNLASIEGLEYLNTSEVKSMNKMFYSCIKITTLNLSDFKTSQVTDMSHMFGSCDALTTIYASDKFTIDNVTSDTYMFRYCDKLKGASSFIEGNWNKNYANYHTGYFSYGINTDDDLKTFANKVNGTYTPAEGETATANPKICVGLMANITLTDADALPAIGSGGYSGTFDGCGHTISGLNFSSASSALFAQNSGTIKNLGIVNANIAAEANGYLCQTNEGTIKNCFFMGKTTGSTQSAGGICETNSVDITNCYYLADSETDEIEGTTCKTADQFKSGEVAYLLSQGTEGSVWGQQLGTDDYPVLSDYKVIKAAKGDKDANENDTYWATFSNLNSDVTLFVPSPRNLNVYNATVSSGTMTLSERNDSQVARGEGVLLKTDGEYVNAKANKTNGLTKVEYANNNLVATPSTAKTITADEGYTLYRLTYNNVSTQDKLGFYLSLVKDENGKVDETSLGKKLKATPGKAYLKVSTEAATTTANAAPARGFVFPGDDETTGIGEIVIEGDAGISGSANANGRIYNLQGQQVTAPVKGLYIKNNKKVIIK